MNNDDKILYKRYQIDRNTEQYLSVFEKSEPKVSIVITTYNAGEMLVEYSLKSVLNQTYKNLEIIIIGDGCTDNTEELLSKIKDSRIYFENKKHEPVPENNQWAMTGASAINRGLQLCTGDYVAHLDDDDFFLPTKIEKLVSFNRTAKADVLHHPFKIFYSEIESLEIKSHPYCCGQVGTSMMFYHGWFSKLPIDLNAEPGEPGDWNKSRRMMEFGTKIARYPEILTLLNCKRIYTTGRNQIKPWMETI